MSHVRAPRSDAQRNRELILEAARVLVATKGIEVSPKEIARAAGVGSGTMYRHFATREDLLEAMLRRRFDALSARAKDLLEAGGPREALGIWLAGFVEGASTYRGLAMSLNETLTNPASPLYASCAGMRSALALLLQRSQAAGKIRADINVDDIFSMAAAIASLNDQQPAAASRRALYLDVILAGLSLVPE